MKFLKFFYFCGSFLPFSILIRIPNTDPDPLTWLNPDPIPIRIWKVGCEMPKLEGGGGGAFLSDELAGYPHLNFPTVIFIEKPRIQNILDPWSGAPTNLDPDSQHRYRTVHMFSYLASEQRYSHFSISSFTLITLYTCATHTIKTFAFNDHWYRRDVF